MKKMSERELLGAKYEHYIENEKCAVFAATFSTYIKSKHVAVRDFPRFWNHEIIYRISNYFPLQLNRKIDHDWVMEMSFDGNYHYHGLIAVDNELKKYIWRDNAINPNLKRDLDALSREGKYRPFKIPKYLIEPIDNIWKWSNYITKKPIITSAS